MQSQGRDVTTGSKVLSIVELANPGVHFEQPFRELFLWAVLMNRLVIHIIFTYLKVIYFVNLTV